MIKREYRKCSECRGDRNATENANTHEHTWLRFPAEVKERLCIQCRRRRHWWYFIDWCH